MAIHISNELTERLARQLAAMEKTGLTAAVTIALANEIERRQAQRSLVDIGVQFCRELRAKANPGGLPADKAFRDSLYEEA